MEKGGVCHYRAAAVVPFPGSQHRGRRHLIAGFVTGLAGVALVAIGAAAADDAIPFESLHATAAPAAVQSWIATHRDRSGSTIIHDAMHSYVIVARGPQPSSGYGVAITGVVRQGDRLLVSVTVRDPGSGEVVLPAFTSPVAVVRIPRHELPLVIRFIRAP